MKIKAIYPGSFDPITNGHLDIIKRSLKIFRYLTIAVVINPHKTALFTLDERMDMLKKATRGLHGITLNKFEGLLVDYAKKVKANVIIRGLRAIADFEYEFQMALMNRNLYKDVELVYMMPSEEYTYLSSSMIREVSLLGGDVTKFVPKIVDERLRQKHGNS